MKVDSVTSTPINPNWLQHARAARPITSQPVTLAAPPHAVPVTEGPAAAREAMAKAAAAMGADIRGLMVDVRA